MFDTMMIVLIQKLDAVITPKQYNIFHENCKTKDPVIVLTTES